MIIKNFFKINRKMQIYSRESFDVEGEIVDLRISVNVIHN